MWASSAVRLSRRPTSAFVAATSRRALTTNASHDVPLIRTVAATAAATSPMLMAAAAAAVAATALTFSLVRMKERMN